MKIIQIIHFAIFLLFLLSCSISKSKSDAYEWQSDSYGENGDLGFTSSEDVEMVEEIRITGNSNTKRLAGLNTSAIGKSETKADVDKKVIFNGNMTLSVKNIDSTSNQLEAIAKKYEGYASEIGTYRTTIRVKSAMVKEAMKEIGELGYVQNKRLSGNDVTNEYLDFQIRLDNAVKARERYLQLLEKAENVEAALLVEKELERLNGTIDMIKGNMNRINHLSEFSTITVNINEKKKPGILGYIGIGIYRSVKWLFVRN